MPSLLPSRSEYLAANTRNRCLESRQRPAHLRRRGRIEKQSGKKEGEEEEGVATTETAGGPGPLRHSRAFSI